MPRPDVLPRPQGPRLPGRQSRGSGNKSQMWNQPGKRLLQAELANVLGIKTRRNTNCRLIFAPSRAPGPSPHHPSPVLGALWRSHQLQTQSPVPPKHLWTPRRPGPPNSCSRWAPAAAPPALAEAGFYGRSRSDNELPGGT